MMEAAQNSSQFYFATLFFHLMNNFQFLAFFSTPYPLITSESLPKETIKFEYKVKGITSNHFQLT
jgi:hypothetical protein